MRKTSFPPVVLITALAIWGTAVAQPSTAPVRVNPLRDAYYGDLHLHTTYSFDAYTAGTAVDPNEAYRFARGEVVEYLGQAVQRRQPLDFMAVTDHAESIGIFSRLEDPNSPISRSAWGKTFKAVLMAITRPDGRRDLDGWSQVPKTLQEQLAKYPDYFLGSKLPDTLQAESVSAWQREITFANSNYKPGTFTTFIAYEWTAQPNGYTLHRNVIFKGAGAPYPFTSVDSKKPEDLWMWLETIRKQGYEALAIPHNGNFSNGLMYDWVDSAGKRIGQAYAEKRQTNEPLSEISQTKGTSETHPLLAPNDEFADFQIIDRSDSHLQELSRPAGSYLRNALSRGLILEREIGVNPFKYGVAGASDFHTGLSVSAQEDYSGSVFTSKLGGGQPSKEEAASVLGGKNIELPDLSVKSTSGNLTGVWAESNTRESIYSALRRRETFATSGTRLRFRFFGGWSFDDALLRDRDWVANAYAKGTPMGGDLAAKPHDAKAPSFAIWAVKDANGANLDRVQVIKVWEEDGQQMEKIFDVTWSGHRRPDPTTGKLPAIGNTVNLKTGGYTNDIGATELKAVWRDPQFDPRRYAAYYLRVLEIPTPRWSTLLAIENGLPLSKDVPATQQRGWSSPIWYAPRAGETM